MFGTNKRRNETSPYATKGDFCRIFEQDMNGLYLLSVLLTGDRAVAEQCFVGGLHIAQEGPSVFSEWAQSWARRAIIQNAIRLVRPRIPVGNTPAALDHKASDLEIEPAEMAGIVALPAFERFVFVMTVLERYTDQECSLLLNCTRADVAAARTRALERLGKFTESARKIISMSSERAMRPDNPVQRLIPELSQGLPASA